MSENYLIIAVLLGVVGAVAAALFFGQGWLKKAVEDTRETKDLSHIVDAIRNRNLLENGDIWHAAIDRLWTLFDRELACKLAVEANKHLPPGDETVNHWVREMAEVEPDLTLETMGKTFVIEKLGLEAEPVSQKNLKEELDAAKEAAKANPRKKLSDKEYAKKKQRRKRAKQSRKRA